VPAFQGFIDGLLSYIRNFTGWELRVYYLLVNAGFAGFISASYPDVADDCTSFLFNFLDHCLNVIYYSYEIGLRSFKWLSFFVAKLWQFW
jgi:hypothetical protein